MSEEGEMLVFQPSFSYSFIHLYKELTPPTPTLHTTIVLGLADKGPSLSLRLWLVGPDPLSVG